MSRCKMRVWASGDKEDCGAPAGSHGYCPSCYIAVRDALREEIRKAEEGVRTSKATLTLLQAAEMDDEVARMNSRNI